MSTIRLRPTFRMATNQSNSETLKKVQKAIQESDKDIAGQYKDGHAVISIVGPERHFWSPWLNLDFRECDSGHEVFGRFSPHPSIWTGFAFAYSAIAVLIFFSAIIGLSQQLASQSPIAYYSIPIWFLIAGALWLASQVGQKLAMTQMVLLKQIVEESLDG